MSAFPKSGPKFDGFHCPASVGMTLWMQGASLLEAYPKEPPDKRILPADHASEVEK